MAAKDSIGSMTFGFGKPETHQRSWRPMQGCDDSTNVANDVVPTGCYAELSDETTGLGIVLRNAATIRVLSGVGKLTIEAVEVVDVDQRMVCSDFHSLAVSRRVHQHV